MTKFSEQINTLREGLINEITRVMRIHNEFDLVLDTEDDEGYQPVYINCFSRWDGDVYECEVTHVERLVPEGQLKIHARALRDKEITFKVRSDYNKAEVTLCVLDDLLDAIDEKIKDYGNAD